MPPVPPRYKRIPMSPRVLWTTIRRQFAPLVMFLVVVSLIVHQWGKVSGGGITGLAEGIRSVVVAPQSAILKCVNVRSYQWVEAGQPIAVLQPIDPKIKLDLAQSELQAARLLAEPSLADQNALDYERLRVEELRLAEELALAKVNLQQAEAALRRNGLLRSDKLVSEDMYDLTLRDRDYYAAQVELKRSALDQVTERVVALKRLGEPGLSGTNQPLHELAVAAQQRIREAAAGWEPVTVVAPISGMVHIVNRQPGEYVVEGELLVSINSPHSDRIVAYLRQPYTVDPRPGMKVEVVTRTGNRERFESEISQVGAQVEAITNSLAFIRPGLLVDVGLPVVVAVPQDVQIRPGEAVEVIFMPPGKAANAQDLQVSRRRSL